jgi:hypothetical protein
MSMKVAVRSGAYRRTGGRCAYCGCVLDPFDFHVDHINAIAVGGENDSVNLIAACSHCNSCKHEKDVEEFRQWHKTTILRRVEVLKEVTTAAWWMGQEDQDKIDNLLIQIRDTVEGGIVHFLIDELRESEGQTGEEKSA